MTERGGVFFINNNDNSCSQRLPLDLGELQQGRQASHGGEVQESKNKILNFRIITRTSANQFATRSFLARLRFETS